MKQGLSFNVSSFLETCHLVMKYSDMSIVFVKALFDKLELTCMEKKIISCLSLKALDLRDWLKDELFKERVVQ